MDRAEAIKLFEENITRWGNEPNARKLVAAHRMAVSALREQVSLENGKQASEKKASEWISVSERLPEDKELVLVTAKNCNPFTCWYNAPFRKWACSGWIEITHWMPLPEPPK